MKVSNMSIEQTKKLPEVDLSNLSNTQIQLLKTLWKEEFLKYSKEKQGFQASLDESWFSLFKITLENSLSLNNKKEVNANLAMLEWRVGNKVSRQG